jgi:hypothetical protein
MIWVGHVICMGEDKYVLVRKHEGKGPLGRPRHRWEDDIKMDLKALAYEGVDWIHLAQDRYQMRALVNTAMNLQVPKKAVDCLTS